MDGERRGGRRRIDGHVVHGLRLSKDQMAGVRAFQARYAGKNKHGLPKALRMLISIGIEAEVQAGRLSPDTLPDGFEAVTSKPTPAGAPDGGAVQAADASGAYPGAADPRTGFPEAPRRPSRDVDDDDSDDWEYACGAIDLG